MMYIAFNKCRIQVMSDENLLYLYTKIDFLLHVYCGVQLHFIAVLSGLFSGKVKTGNILALFYSYSFCEQLNNLFF